MRNILLCAVLGLVSFSLACGDADTTSSSSKRGGKGGTFADPYQDDDPGEAPADGPADPNATSRPNAPSTPGTTTGSFSIAVDNATPQVDLAAKTTLNITVTAQNGYTGNVALSATGLPQGVTAVFTPASVTVGASPATAKVEFTSSTDSPPSAAGVAAKIHGAGDQSANADANMTFKVNNVYTMHIPTNISALNAAGANTSLSSQFSKPFASGLVLMVHNDDGTAHEIHGNNQAGLTHGTGTIAPGAYELGADGNPKKRNITASGGSGYLHGEATGTNSPFSIQVN